MTTKEARVYNGRYELVRHVARGGMAEVYQARDLLLDRSVALKVLFPELSVDRSFVERFRREAQAAASLSHQNIVSIYDWGEEEGTYFIVMEYIDGLPLSQLLRDEGRPPPERAAQIGGQVAAALSFAHRHGVVHRDIKPGNILLDKHGNVKVTDFGIARAGDPKENLTQTGVVMGTATYFSPEQAQGFPTDARTDLYSLGVVLYEMATGKPPFSGETPVAIAYKHVKEDPLPPSSIEATLPAGFEAIVLCAMAKKVDERYPNADEMRGDLVRFLRGQTPKAIRVREALAAAAVPVATEAVAVEPTMAMTAAAVGGGGTGLLDRRPAPVPLDEPDRPRSMPWVVLSALLLGVLIVLVVLLARLLGIGDGGGGVAQLSVPSVLGKTEAEARTTLEGAKFKVEIKDGEDTTKPVGSVLQQDPAPNVLAAEGSTVTLTINRAPEGIEIPRVIDLQESQAKKQLEEAGFKVEISSARNENVDEGFVFEQSPTAGTLAPQGSTVRITVSSGSGLGPVPNVVGKTQAEAESQLKAAGFTVRVRTGRSDAVPAGSVFQTDPRAGEKLGKGQTQVTIYVAEAAPTTTVSQVTVPNVVGMTEADAEASLQSRGLVVRKETSSGGIAGRVKGQNPSAGSKVAPGSTVVITVSTGGGGTTTSTTESTVPTP